MFSALAGALLFLVQLFILTMTTATPITRDQLIYDCAVWAIDEDPELLQELLEAYFSKLSTEDLEELHGRVYQ